jgi:hypothetical protein
MLDRHLLPNELELLVDDEEGFGVTPLRAHVEHCADCREQLAVERELVELLEHVPHLAPTAGFQDRVMREVQVFEPWHVALTNTLRRMVPPPGPWRTLAAAGIGGATLSLSVIVAWAVVRLDTLIFVAQVGIERAQTALIAGAGEVVALAFGESAAAALPTASSWGTVAALAAVVASFAVAGLGLRGLVALARRGR